MRILLLHGRQCFDRFDCFDCFDMSYIRFVTFPACQNRSDGSAHLHDAVQCGPMRRIDTRVAPSKLGLVIAFISCC